MSKVTNDPPPPTRAKKKYDNSIIRNGCKQFLIVTFKLQNKTKAQNLDIFTGHKQSLCQILVSLDF